MHLAVHLKSRKPGLGYEIAGQMAPAFAIVPPCGRPTADLVAPVEVVVFLVDVAKPLESDEEAREAIHVVYGVFEYLKKIRAGAKMV